MVTVLQTASEPLVSSSIGPDRSPQGRVRVRVRTLVFTRWLAVAGQVIALLTVSEGLGVELPMLAAMAAVFCSAALNIVLTLRRGLSGWHSEAAAAGYLAYDILQLAALLYLTGGLENPFALLFLVPVTISATILSLVSTVMLGLLSSICVSLLFSAHLPLPWPPPGLQMPPVYKLAIWVALSLGMGFLMFYAWRVAEEARRMSEALWALQARLSRERELASLGSLAAAAAHELGTPLGTIALVSKELVRDVPQDSAHHADIELLNDQAERCRQILTRLAANPSEGADRSVEQQPFDALVSVVAEAHRSDTVQIVIDTRAADSMAGRPPSVWRSPELVQGLGNLIENAADFARSQVSLQLRWSAQDVVVEITDDGPGFSADVLRMIGEPYVSTRPNRGRMGLGVFISKTLLERTGASVQFSNRLRGRGARVVISWQRSVLEEPESIVAGSG